MYLAYFLAGLFGGSMVCLLVFLIVNLIKLRKTREKAINREVLFDSNFTAGIKVREELLAEKLKFEIKNREEQHKEQCRRFAKLCKKYNVKPEEEFLRAEYFLSYIRPGSYSDFSIDYLYNERALTDPIEKLK